MLKILKSEKKVCQIGQKLKFTKNHSDADRSLEVTVSRNRKLTVALKERMVIL